jgi:cytochrome c6
LDQKEPISAFSFDSNTNRSMARHCSTASAVVVAVALAFLGLASVTGARDKDDSGKDIFESNCAMCHGDDGTGTDAGRSLGAPDLSSDDVQKLSDDMLFDVISKGKNNMPSFKDQLSQDDIKAAISHVRTFAAKR